MPQTDYNVTIDIIRPGRIKTSGGYQEVLPPVGGTYLARAVTATMHFYSRQSQRSVESQGREAGGVPGISTVTDRIFKINLPAAVAIPEVKRGDIVVIAGGETLKVSLPERRYIRTLQIDTELIP